MGSPNDNQDSSSADKHPSSSEQDHAGNSGEGAASALAQLKTQTRQHRRQLGDNEDPSGEPGQ